MGESVPTWYILLAVSHSAVGTSELIMQIKENKNEQI